MADGNMSWYGTACTACESPDANEYDSNYEIRYTKCTAEDYYHDLKCVPGTFYENGECGDKDTVDREYIQGFEV